MIVVRNGAVVRRLSVALSVAFLSSACLPKPSTCQLPTDTPPDTSQMMMRSASLGSRLTGAQHAEQLHQRFIVKMGARSLVQTAEAHVARMSADLGSGAVIRPVSNGVYGVELENPQSSADVAARMGQEIEYIEPDYVTHTTTVPNDPMFGQQWAHAKVDSADAWSIYRGSANVTVAVLDTGIDYTHPDLAGNMWVNPDSESVKAIGDKYGWNFVSNNGEVKADDDSSYHGTHVAGSIGAIGNNGLGVVGSSPVVKLMALKFMGADGSGFTSNAVKGIDYAIAHHAKIISNSWGSPFGAQTLADAVERARAAGILFVAAAGNDGANNDKTSFYPANYASDNVVSVAASDQSDRLASFSNYGLAVDLAAPGVSILSTKNGASYQALSGTSMATPLVSGVLATMMGLRPDLSYLAIKNAMLKNVDAISALKGKIATGGRVNAYRSLASIQATTEPIPTETPSPAPSSDPCATDPKGTTGTGSGSS